MMNLSLSKIGKKYETDPIMRNVMKVEEVF